MARFKKVIIVDIERDGKSTLQQNKYDFIVKNTQIKLVHPTHGTN